MCPMPKIGPQDRFTVNNAEYCLPRGTCERGARGTFVFTATFTARIYQLRALSRVRMTHTDWGGTWGAAVKAQGAVYSRFSTETPRARPPFFWRRDLVVGRILGHSAQCVQPEMGAPFPWLSESRQMRIYGAVRARICDSEI